MSKYCGNCRLKESEIKDTLGDLAEMRETKERLAKQVRSLQTAIGAISSHMIGINAVLMLLEQNGHAPDNG